MDDLPNLRSLMLRVTYRTGYSDILNEFYIPCLENSVIYKRAVGYFTSSCLAEAARGLVGLIKNGGRMYLISSPRLTEQDKKDIAAGYELRKIVEKRLIEGIREPISDVDVIRIRNLTWMIANGRLDVKIAVPTSVEGEGIYHEKMGLFFDSLNPDESNVVAFSGSLNETREGLVSNYESIDVYVSWDPSEREVTRVKEHIAHFERMWNNEELGLLVLDFPDAVKKELIQTYKPPYEPTQEPGKRKRLFNFQEEAIKSWVKAYRKGILAMATGSGKTFTALKCVETCPQPTVNLIVVPSIDLISQWEEEIRQEYGEQAVIRKVSSEEAHWEEKIATLIKAFNTNVITQPKKIFVIATIHSAIKNKFLEMIATVPSEKLAIIVDEVHHSGAQDFRRIFNIEAAYRLGLSATPEREWDDEGNQRIFDYFGPTVYTYDIAKALQDGKLSRYEYYIHLTALTPSEREEFRKLSRSIAALISKIHRLYPSTKGMDIPKTLNYLESIQAPEGEQLRNLYLSRVELLKKASSKAQKLREIVNNYPLQRCLVYCNDLDHLVECLKILFEEGYEVYEYSSRIEPEVRQRVLMSFAETSHNSKFLVAVKCLDEGIDVPICDSSILVSSSRSTREFIQRRGRVLRVHPTKPKSVIHDIVILPFTNWDDAYGLTPAEYDFVEAELRRISEFAKNAINKEDLEISIERLKRFFDQTRIPNGER
jgi:superfamily II DNA or RNA helicase